MFYPWRRLERLWISISTTVRGHFRPDGGEAEEYQANLWGTLYEMLYSLKIPGNAESLLKSPVFAKMQPHVEPNGVMRGEETFTPQDAIKVLYQDVEQGWVIRLLKLDTLHMRGNQDVTEWFRVRKSAGVIRKLVCTWR